MSVGNHFVTNGNGNRWPRKENGAPPPPKKTGTEGLLIVENALDCIGFPYGFNRRGSGGAPKKWPKYRTPARK